MFILFYLIAYLMLVMFFGIWLVQYIITAFGGHINAIFAFIVALITGFNFLVPMAIFTWFLQIVHILH